MRQKAPARGVWAGITCVAGPAVSRAFGYPRVGPMIKSEYCSLYIAFSRQNYDRPKSVPFEKECQSVRCERYMRRHVGMCVDGVNRIVKFVYISVAHLMRGPLNPSLVVIACKGSQTDCLPSFIPLRWQRMFSARKGSGP